MAACLLNLLLLIPTEATLGHSVRCTVPEDLDRNRLSRAGSLSQSGLPDGLSHTIAQGNPELDQLLESRDDRIAACVLCKAAKLFRVCESTVRVIYILPSPGNC